MYVFGCVRVCVCVSRSFGINVPEKSYIRMPRRINGPIGLNAPGKGC